MTRLRSRVYLKPVTDESVKITVCVIIRFMALTEEPEAQKCKKCEGVGGKKVPEARQRGAKAQGF